MMTERAFVDTNLFLRYLTNDVPAQADMVERLLQRAAAGEMALVTNTLVIAEIVWTLESFYKLSRDRIKLMVLAILNTPGLDVDQTDLILTSVTHYADKNVDFIDAFSAAWAAAEGITVVYTFNRKHFNRLKVIETREPGEEGLQE
jgi:predicted nucleic-acid-binding protein